MNEDRKGYWGPLYSGGKYWPLDPRPEDINIVDIARGLAYQCRYNGQTSGFYSVAEHSMIVSTLVPEHLALEGLLHDASEAYIGDMARPIKIEIPMFSEIELLHSNAIRTAFGLPLEESHEVKEADNNIFLAEFPQLFKASLYSELMNSTKVNRLKEGASLSHPVVIRCLPPEIAQQMFLDRFVELYYKHLEEGTI